MVVVVVLVLVLVLLLLLLLLLVTLNDCWKLLSQPDVASKLPVVSSEIGDTWLYVEKHILV